MDLYLTVEEAAEKWGLTVHHVQYMCRSGKIKGAVKRAGAWFVPGDVYGPAKSPEANENPYLFKGTKKNIFESAVKLFARDGYENVSINDIAEAAGIRQSAVYNHYKSKHELLETMYGYCGYHYLLNRPCRETQEEQYLHGSVIDTINKGFIYTFSEEAIENMSGIIKIIFSRMATDRFAADFVRTLMLEEGIKYVEEGLDSAIEIGRFAKMDTHAVSILVNSVRLYTFLWWIIDTDVEHHLRVLKDEQRAFERIADLFTDLKR